MLRNPNHVYGSNTLQVPVNLNFGEYFLDKITAFKDDIAMINGKTDERKTYAEILQESMNFAVSLTRMGVRKGEIIGIFSENRLEFWGAVIGVVCAGAVLTPIGTGYVKGELLHVLNISKPSYIICSPSIYKTHAAILKTLPFLKKIILFGEENLPGVIMYNDLVFEKNKKIRNVNYEQFKCVEVQGQTDTMFLMYSSGTTGLPKGVLITHLNVIASCIYDVQYPKHITLAISPWYHAMGLVGNLTGLVIGRVGIYLPQFDMELYFNTIEKYKVTQLAVVPPILVAACKYPTKHDLSSVTLIRCGAAPLYKDTVQAGQQKFPNAGAVFQGYGCTEMSLSIIASPLDGSEYKPGSVGKVQPNVIVKVVDLSTGKALGPNMPGEICAKGGTMMKGYVGQERSQYIDDEGFYRTGDIGYYDDDQSFYVVDRLKELIKYKGFQVPPAEVEAVLLEHPSIKEAGVIGVEDKESGEMPLAFVVTQPGKQLTEQEVKDFVAERLSSPKHLRGGVRFLDQIPKSASGKLLRKELRNMVKATKSRL